HVRPHPHAPPPTSPPPPRSTLFPYTTLFRSQVSGPIPLPTKRQLWTVLRSPHIDKKSREQFELKTHKRLIDILDSRSQTIDRLRSEEHTSELQSPYDLVCRLLLEKKKK